MCDDTQVVFLNSFLVTWWITRRIKFVFQYFFPRRAIFHKLNCVSVYIEWVSLSDWVETGVFSVFVCSQQWVGVSSNDVGASCLPPNNLSCLSCSHEISNLSPRRLKCVTMMGKYIDCFDNSIVSLYFARLNRVFHNETRMDFLFNSKKKFVNPLEENIYESWKLTMNTIKDDCCNCSNIDSYVICWA